MKRIIALCIIAILCLTFVACSNDRDDTQVTDTTEATTVTDDDSNTTEDSDKPTGDGNNEETTTPPTADEVWNDVTPDTGNVGDGYTPRF